MNTLIFRTIAPLITVVMIAFSIFVMLRGHNEPGGGFIGGLVAAAAIALVLLSDGAEAARRALVVPPLGLVGTGLGLAAASGLAALPGGGAYLEGVWTPWTLPVLGGIHFSSPLLFDTGVYLLVTGMTCAILFGLQEEE